MLYEGPEDSGHLQRHAVQRLRLAAGYRRVLLCRGIRRFFWVRFGRSAFKAEIAANGRYEPVGLQVLVLRA